VTASAIVREPSCPFRRQRLFNGAWPIVEWTEPLKSAVI